MDKKTTGKPDSRERILDVAERLFSTSSFASVSVRAVTAEAGVNLSAVNYYFGSKKGLFQAVYRRRCKEMNRQRLDLLHAAAEAAEQEGRQITMFELISALLSPPIRWLHDEDGGLSVYIKFIARAYLEEASDMANVLEEEVAVYDKFIPYIREIHPELSEEDIYWRIHFTLGAQHHTINHLDRIGILSHNNCKVRSWEETRDRLVRFCVDGF
ncbi:TetR/AcrR family transcriptional regulator [Emcibacter nanhaiensis]|uniref:TetR/AcrR family transcriptional regulator n=1 Tax=Emcibacter nanhaiensis TaxID=1505037 RepID=A0A501PQR4_9PROT|nr:TetR/AcrR family transcriptional regulator [Emcibacter nanhaiensis]TPD62870.1 TetR/AcrR family transcriptional regulator [Emcibacter nanhaiensis]